MNDERGERDLCNFTTPPEDFAIEEVLPVLVLTPAPVHGTGRGNGPPAGDRVAAFVEAVSAYEQSLGGEGLHVFDPVPPVGPDRVALVPWKADGARDRLEQVARWATGEGALATAASVA